MRLTDASRNAMVDAFAKQLDGGALVFYSGTRPVDGDMGLREPLASVRFSSPAFTAAKSGKAVSHPLAEAEVLVTDVASWAQIVSVSGQLVAELTVRAKDDPGSASADFIVDRTDFHRGGKCIVAPLTLALADAVRFS